MVFLHDGIVLFEIITKEDKYDRESEYKNEEDHECDDC